MSLAANEYDIEVVSSSLDSPSGSGRIPSAENIRSKQRTVVFLMILFLCFKMAFGVSSAQVAVTSSTQAAEDLPQLIAQAERSSARAQYNLGVAYADGEVVPRNYVEAVKWFKKAASQGLGVAEHDLGSMYIRGQGVPQNYREAVYWFRKAAAQGLAESESSLGGMYANGQGVKQDYEEAVRWFRKAASDGSAQAQCNLGMVYASGLGAKRDYSEAVKWFQESAAQGDTLAQFDLGRLYASGLGVNQDDIQAYMWLSLAASTGEENALELRDYLSRNMTHDQTEKADHLAASISGGFVQKNN